MSTMLPCSLLTLCRPNMFFFTLGLHYISQSRPNISCILSRNFWVIHRLINQPAINANVKPAWIGGCNDWRNWPEWSDYRSHTHKCYTDWRNIFVVIFSHYSTYLILITTRNNIYILNLHTTLENMQTTYISNKSACEGTDRYSTYTLKSIPKKI